ncbi:hypothetical protein [Latilactobacillus sakei]|uniref:hypothetical protein n=1 Tax=Latilactobacillus sakei TaxID=1599 RepID=UPI0009769045|nr:hypothetical protein [Latilactobacillus sakei]ASN12223.1 hypothetical protein B4V05_02955 [Latilactobacillus sakei]MCM1636690.1 hypothetical protein [Latilactobacillus sakei]PKX60382.1 hypothetical protein CUR39_09975 [Latilactobacillus sakei]PKX69248.1 hypothetical protein CUR36_09480 [Latilactobacillus sakei]RFN55742.1 hypothetical protein DT321_09715 [Latilactobacillus sakei]
MEEYLSWRNIKLNIKGFVILDKVELTKINGGSAAGKWWYYFGFGAATRTHTNAKYGHLGGQITY